MGNNEIVPGFDEISISEQASWLDPFGVNIIWSPIDVKISESSNLAKCLEVRLSGELDFFAASHLRGQLFKAIKAGFIYLILDFEKASMGDFREVLFFDVLRALEPFNGFLISCDLPKALFAYLQYLGGGSLENRYMRILEQMHHVVAETFEEGILKAEEITEIGVSTYFSDIKETIENENQNQMYRSTGEDQTHPTGFLYRYNHDDEYRNKIDGYLEDLEEYDG